MLPPRYRNYWLDLARKEIADEEKERQKAISTILAFLHGAQKPQNQPKKKKP